MRSDPVTLPEPKPGIIGVHFVVPLVGGGAVGQGQGASIRKGVKAFQPLDLGDGFVEVHNSKYSYSKHWMGGVQLLSSAPGKNNESRAEPANAAPVRVHHFAPRLAAYGARASRDRVGSAMNALWLRTWDPSGDEPSPGRVSQLTASGRPDS